MSAATACWKQSTQQSWKKCEHSFLFPWMPPTWYEKTSQELLSCRNRRSRTEKHLQLLFYSSGGTESVRGGVFPYKNIRPLTKSVPASLQKVLTVISWPKSSGSAGVSWSSVFFWVFFFFFGVNRLWLTEQFPIWIFTIIPLPRFTLIERLNWK